MKIFWLCNVILPKFANALGIPEQVSGGWLAGAANAVSKDPHIELVICAPQNISSENICTEVEGITFYGYPASSKPVYAYDPKLEECFSRILQQVNPDLVHIWGTEFPHALAMTRIFANPDRTLINIQGLCSFIANHYMGHLPHKPQQSKTIRDILRSDNLIAQREKFVMRGNMEKEALQNVGHVIGRTNWDRVCTERLAPHAKYYSCNETLRNSFYEHSGEWRADKCERHSVFVSQANYPLKGFHIVLEAMPEILRRYPDAHLYTTGNNPLLAPFYRINSYQKWLKKRILQLGLKDHVTFLGPLNEEKMCGRFLKSNVFVSASSVENSPNSVGEAMLLGVPTVASYVGGTMDMLEDGHEGYLYQPDAPYMLADHVCSIFNDDDKAFAMGQNAVKHAKITHNPEENLQTLLWIYKGVKQQ